MNRDSERNKYMNLLIICYILLLPTQLIEVYKVCGQILQLDK